MSVNKIAIITAAGSGTRMNAGKNKLLLEIGGMTVIERTVRTFSQMCEIDEIIVTAKESDIELYEKVLSEYDISYAIGGETRQQSVKNAVETIDECKLLIIHDGARPLVTAEEIRRAVDYAEKYGSAAVGVPVKDTIKVVDCDKKIIDTPNRSSLTAIQTPQVFHFDDYVCASKLAQKQGKDFTDDCRLLENAGKSVYVAPGEYTNIKITTPEDIPVAEAILKMRGDA